MTIFTVRLWAPSIPIKDFPEVAWIQDINYHYRYDGTIALDYEGIGRFIEKHSKYDIMFHRGNNTILIDTKGFTQR